MVSKQHTERFRSNTIGFEKSYCTEGTMMYLRKRLILTRMSLFLIHRTGQVECFFKHTVYILLGSLLLSFSVITSVHATVVVFHRLFSSLYRSLIIFFLFSGINKRMC